MSIHSMSDEEFEDFEFESAHWDEVAESDNPEDEDNYDDVAETCAYDRDIPSADVLGPVPDVWGSEDPTIDDPTIHGF